VHIPFGALAPLALVILVTAVSCTGLGLLNGAIGLRVRESSVSSNIVFGVLLVVCGVNVPRNELPGWLAAVGSGLPLTHGIAAARKARGWRGAWKRAGARVHRARDRRGLGGARLRHAALVRARVAPSRDVGELVTVARLVWAGWWMNVRQMARSSLFIFTSVIEPLIMASIAFYTVKAGGNTTALFYMAIGAGIMGMWSTTLFASGGVVSWQRWQGTLELLVGVTAVDAADLIEHCPAPSRAWPSPATRTSCTAPSDGPASC